jgi:hypothetical protein
VAPHFWIRDAGNNYSISPEEILPKLTRMLSYIISMHFFGSFVFSSLSDKTTEGECYRGSHGAI